MTKHSWVKHTLTEVHPLSNDGGDPIVFVDPVDQEVAEDNAAYGCNDCDAALTAETLESECPGPEEDQ